MKRKLTKCHKTENISINQMIGKYIAINPINCVDLKDNFKGKYHIRTHTNEILNLI